MTLEELIAKQEIAELLARFARGADRFDLELVRASYHPDGVDEHGFFTGPPDEFIEFISSPENLPSFNRTMHFNGAPLIELDGDTAYAETYCLAFHEAPEGHPWGPANLLIALRYVDRLERRDGKWALVRRTLAYEWLNRLPLENIAEILPPEGVMGRRDRGDLVYTIKEGKSNGTPAPSADPSAART